MASKLLALLGALSWLLVVRGLRDESEAAAWLDEYYLRSPEVFMPSRYASWNYNTNLTDYNSEQIVSIPNSPSDATPHPLFIPATYFLHPREPRGFKKPCRSRDLRLQIIRLVNPKWPPLHAYLTASRK